MFNKQSKRMAESIGALKGLLLVLSGPHYADNKGVNSMLEKVKSRGGVSFVSEKSLMVSTCS